MLGQAGEAQVAHFNSHKEKVAALSAYPRKIEVNGKTIDLRAPRNCVEVTAEVNAGRISPAVVHGVPVRIKTPVVIDKTPNPKELRPITLVTGRKLEPEEFFVHALAMADITKGNGFRQPSAKAKNWQSTSLMEQISIRMGVSKERKGPERSERGQKKLAARIEANASIMLDRLIEQHPDKARKAKKEERYVEWFVGKVMEALSGTPKVEELRTMVQARIEKIKVPKHVIEFEEFAERAKLEAERRALDQQIMQEAA